MEHVKIIVSKTSGKISVNDVPLLGVVSFSIHAKVGELPRVEFTMLATVEFEGEADIDTKAQVILKTRMVDDVSAFGRKDEMGNYILPSGMMGVE